MPFSFEKRYSDISTAVGTESDNYYDLQTDWKRRPRVFSSSTSEEVDFATKVIEYTKVLDKEARLERSQRATGNKPRLTSIIKDFKQRGLEKLEEDFKTVNHQTSPVVFRLAFEYLKNSREKAKQVLSSSSLPESQYLMMKLWYEDGEYQDACYHSHFLTCLKCTCIGSSPIKSKSSPFPILF